MSGITPQGSIGLAGREPPRQDLECQAAGMGSPDRPVAEGFRSRVVAMPSWDIFERETPAYRDGVLPPEVRARVAIEQASTLGWERYVGREGRIIGMQTFGASAPLKALQQAFGFTVDQVVKAARSALEASVRPRRP